SVRMRSLVRVFAPIALAVALGAGACDHAASPTAADHEPPGAGGSKGRANTCPTIDALSAMPTAIVVGGAVTLGAVAHDPDGQPSALTYQWTTSAGAVSATGAAATFVCTTAGAVTVMVMVSDGDCKASGTVTLTCSPGLDAGVPDAGVP